MNDIRGKLVEYKLIYDEKVGGLNKQINKLLDLNEGWQIYSKVEMKSPKENGHDHWTINIEMARFESEEE